MTILRIDYMEEQIQKTENRIKKHKGYKVITVIVCLIMFFFVREVVQEMIYQGKLDMLPQIGFYSASKSTNFTKEERDILYKVAIDGCTEFYETKEELQDLYFTLESGVVNEDRTKYTPIYTWYDYSIVNMLDDTTELQELKTNKAFDEVYMSKNRVPADIDNISGIVFQPKYDNKVDLEKDRVTYYYKGNYWGCDFQAKDVLFFDENYKITAREQYVNWHFRNKYVKTLMRRTIHN